MMKFIRLFVQLTLMSLIICNIGCSNKEYENSGDTISFKQLRQMKESPMLAEKVAVGELPPLNERLPDEPLIVEPLNEIGVHGGTWHFDITTRRDINLVYHISTPSFLQWKSDGIHHQPYFCKHYKGSDDGKIWTFYLRKGVKWSDGHPFTSEDVRFWYEDDAMNRDISTTPKHELQIGKQFGIVKIVDDYTFQVLFPDTNKAFYEYMTSIVLFYSPSHYLKQFHEKYADKDELERKMKESGVRKWSELYTKMDRWYEGFYNPDRPTMRPWMPAKGGGSPNTFEFVRNPYYWAVDTEGKQLPYIDRIVVHIASNDQVLAMKTIAGDFDFQWRRLDFKDYPLLKENSEKQNYTLLTWPQDRGSDVALYINYNCTHPVVGPLFREMKFRQALSVAINREEINLLFYKNIGIPRQVTAAENTPFYVPEFARNYAQYDVTLANQLLDELDLVQRDENGFRLDQHGEPIFIFLETSDLEKVDILQIVSEHWQEIGIKSEVRIMEGSLLTRRTHSAEVMIQARPHGSFMPGEIRSRSDYIAPKFGHWRLTNGKQGQEPTPEFKKLIWLNERRKRCDAEESINVFKQIYKLHSENLWSIGLVGEVPALLAKKNYFMNVPDKSLYSYMRGRRLQLTFPEQYWIDPRKLNN